MNVLSGVFSSNNKVELTRLARSALRTSAGLSADVATAGAGGDVVVNSVFAVSSSMSFMHDLAEIATELNKSSLMRRLVNIHTGSKIPIKSKIRLDDGLDVFEEKFMKIYKTANARDKQHAYVLAKKLLNRLIVVLSDWIACLFPDTAGLAGEVARSTMEYISANGFTYTYNLLAFIPGKLQVMITNPYAFSAMLRSVVDVLKKLLGHINANDMAKLLTKVGSKQTGWRRGIKLGTDIGSYGLKTVGSVVPTGATVGQVEHLLLSSIDKYVIPNIDTGAELFYELFPLYLLFTLIIEKHRS